jgi:hypothetical protein
VADNDGGFCATVQTLKRVSRYVDICKSCKTMTMTCKKNMISKKMQTASMVQIAAEKMPKTKMLFCVTASQGLPVAISFV